MEPRSYEPSIVCNDLPMAAPMLLLGAMVFGDGCCSLGQTRAFQYILVPFVFVTWLGPIFLARRLLARQAPNMNPLTSFFGATSTRAKGIRRMLVMYYAMYMLGVVIITKSIEYVCR